MLSKFQGRSCEIVCHSTSCDTPNDMNYADQRLQSMLQLGISCSYMVKNFKEF